MTTITSPTDPGAVTPGLPDGAFGLHLTVDWAGGQDSPRLVSDAGHVAGFARALVERIDMTAAGAPQTPWFPAQETVPAGITLVQIVTTSAITAHLMDDTGNGHLDVFSCKSFDPGDVLDVVAEWFAPAAAAHTVLVRSAPAVPTPVA